MSEENPDRTERTVGEVYELITKELGGSPGAPGWAILHNFREMMKERERLGVKAENLRIELNRAEAESYRRKLCIECLEVKVARLEAEGTNFEQTVIKTEG